MLHIPAAATAITLLQTLFQFLDYGDELGFALRQDGEIRLHTEVPGVPHDSNLIVRAARRLQEASATGWAPISGWISACPWRRHRRRQLGCRHYPCLASITRGRPRLGEERLAELGLALGPTSAVFVRGRAASPKRVGEQLQPVELAEPWFLSSQSAGQCQHRGSFAAPELTRDTPAIKVRSLPEGVVITTANRLSRSVTRSA